MKGGSADLSGLDADQLLLFDRLCDLFQKGWEEGERPRIEAYLAKAPSQLHDCLLREMLALEVGVRRLWGEQPVLEEYLARFPSAAHQLTAALQDIQSHCPNSNLAQQIQGRPSDLRPKVDQNETVSDSCLGRASRQANPEPVPEQIGRYRIMGLLGQGGFGLVYQGYDDQLNRGVAIKVPHAHLVAEAGTAETYLSEARVVASLDHANIVQVYDVGSSIQYQLFIVSKLIEGCTLAQRIKEKRLEPLESAMLVSEVAKALHYAHKREIIHRDIKPSNILLDRTGKPFVADFGLALEANSLVRVRTFVGTPPYMSPEQARGEGHRVDGRSDIFSLGIVFYELLTGRRPFQASTREDLLESICTFDPRPPRQLDDTIPRELERICLKALAKRASERYTTALDMAEDLIQFRGPVVTSTRPETREHAVEPAFSPITQSAPTLSPTPSSNRPIKIVPKGLRSFDEHDADFFLELLPGPRDRDNLPESIRFWKMRIESIDQEVAFSVGLIYGPSGCGKSSMVKAGLLPRLDQNIAHLYVEATPDDTEMRLLKCAQREVVGLPDHLGLKEAMTWLRHAALAGRDGKLVIIIDQFEQWLHANQEVRGAELVQALRQCDGRHLQCILLVRDDFWLATTRFLRELEVDLLQGHNTAVVDLFDLEHARRVLVALGGAQGKLPAKPADMNKEQRAFVEQAVAAVAQDGKVMCVRLALFAEMMKSRPWTPTTLRSVGGLGGLGVSFLEETFASPAANPKHRLHQKAARAVLSALLPDLGTNIKGNMRSRPELIQASGYALRPAEFAELMRILDRETRLITPTDREGNDPESDSASGSQDERRYYQLTHDYLVPSLRDWLVGKQKQTWSGRASLLLAERAALWQTRPEKRHLPAPGEWAFIRAMTWRRDWTPGQRSLMRKADRYYLARGILIVVCLALTGWTAWEFQSRLQARNLRDRLLSSALPETPAIIQEINFHRHRVDPLLHQALEREADPRKRVLLSMALLPTDKAQVPFLYEQLLQASPQDFGLLLDTLAPYREELETPLWTEFADPNGQSGRRFRAACALLVLTGDDGEAFRCATYLAGELAGESPSALEYWKLALKRGRDRFLPALASALGDVKWDDRDRRTLIEFYVSFSGASPDAARLLEDELAEGTAKSAVSPDRANHLANVAVALAALGKCNKVWPLLVHTPTPTLRSYLIERLASAGIDPKVLEIRLGEEKDTSARRALILALGGYSPRYLTDFTESLLRFYEHDPDPGIHAASGWVLRKLNQGSSTATIDSKLATGQVESGRHWYTDKQGQSFAILDDQIIGAANLPKGMQRPRYRFAVACTELTVGQFRSFKSTHGVDETISRTPDSPVNKVTWYDAAEYCNWLSQQEHIPESEWCFKRNAAGLLDLVPDYWARRGYRLATEAEWVLASLAGADTPCSFGEADEELIGAYAWWVGNARVNGERRAFPVGLRKPNDWGLFDMHGNVSEWCLESMFPQQGIYGKDIEVGFRGGSFAETYRKLGRDNRDVLGRTFKSHTLGIRLARSLPEP